MPLFNRRRQLPSDQFRRAEGNAMIPKWTRPPERNTYDWIKMFSKSPRLAVVERIASDLSFATGKLYVVGSDGEESEITRHSFLEFWAHPNPLHEFSAAALWRLEEIYLLLKGEGYFVIEKDPAGRPAELWPVPTHWVMMTPYLGHPYYTVKTTSGSIMDVSVDDMFVMKDINPLDPFLRGLGQAEAIADEVEIDEYAAQFQKRFFYNDATPNIIVSMPGSSDEQRKRFRAEWLERFKGVFKSHGIATTGGDISIQKVAESMKDMDMINGRTFIRNATLEHFGVPREIMGITESSNRATSEAAQYIYAQNVLMPRLRRREEAINQQLLPMFGEGLLWRYDDIVPRNQEFDKMFGYVMENELKAIDGIMLNPERPFCAILGGSKVSTKITIIENLLEKVDVLVLGGGMTYTFAAAEGGKVGNSICEPDQFQTALDILAKAKEKGVKVVMSPDALIADAFSADANTNVAPANNIPDGWEGVDIADEGKKVFREEILKCKTILWNGPVGVFEIDKFATGSRAVAEAIAEATSKGASSLIGGGDSVACINKFGLADKVSYVSTGGGALLEYMEGKELPGVAAIRK